MMSNEQRAASASDIQRPEAAPGKRSEKFLFQFELKCKKYESPDRDARWRLGRNEPYFILMFGHSFYDIFKISVTFGALASTWAISRLCSHRNCLKGTN